MPLTKLMDVLRLVGAGLFIFISLGLSVVFISRFFPEALPVWIVVPLLVAGFFVFVFLAMVLFRGKGPGRISAEAYAVRIRKLEEDGLLVLQSFRDRRAFQVDEFEDEGSHYYVELEDGVVLFLTGQYLYNYAPRAGRRTFPCSKFTVRRHKEKGFAVDILCQGEVIEPEVQAPSFDEEDYRKRLIPEDGTLLRDKTYDQIKRERLKEK